MPPNLPHRPPLAMKLWLFRRTVNKETTGGTASGLGHASGYGMNVGSLEHMMRSRVRLFLRHTWLVTITGTVALVAAIWASFYYSTRADQMRIAATPTDVRFVQALRGEIAKGHHQLSLQLVPVKNEAEAAEALRKGAANLAILPSNMADAANWPAVAILRQNAMLLIVPVVSALVSPPSEAKTAAPTAAKKPAAGTKKVAASKPAKAAATSKGGKADKATKTAKAGKADSGDDSDDSDDSSAGDDSAASIKIAQLAGKRIGIVSGNEATPALLELVLRHYGIAASQVVTSSIDPGDIADAVKSNRVDALFVAGAATGSAISNAVAAASVDGKPPSFIDIDQADGMAKRHPAFDSVDIDAGTFGGTPPMPGDSVKTLTFDEYLVARRSYSDSVTDTLAKTIYTSRQMLAAAEPGDIAIKAPSTDKDGAVVVHPGALAYLSDTQQSFFDKYGDDIFYGMLLFPLLGSAIAGLASYLRSNTRTQRLRLLQRALDLVRKAHVAPTVQAIEQLQIEADNLVIAIVHQGEREEFDEAVRMSFAFALDQLRFTLANRRAALTEQTGAAPAEPATEQQVAKPAPAWVA